MKCHRCGVENGPDAVYCQECGASLDTLPQPNRSAKGRATVQLQANGAGMAAPAGGGNVTRSASTLRDTAPLEEFSNQFAALPEGAVLGKRYIVREIRVAGERHNVYLTDDLIAVRECANCGRVTSDAEERFCDGCGADLLSVVPTTLRYLVQEYANGGAYALERQLLGMQLAHPGLLLPLAIFDEAPYGAPRVYRVMPEFSPSLAQSLPVPQAVDRAVGWGVALAQAMAHLHRYQIAIGAVDLGHIAVSGQLAVWTGLNDVTIIPPEERASAEKVFAVDVQRLAWVLVQLLTGGDRPGAEPSLPDSLKQLLGQVYQRPGEVSAADFAVRLESVLREVRRPAHVSLLVGRRTDVGSVRELNEDSYLTLDLSPAQGLAPGAGSPPTEPVSLFLVADGMGGYDAGEVASQLASYAVAKLAKEEVVPLVSSGGTLADPGAWLKRAVEAANRAVHDERRKAGSEMGTTLVTSLLMGATATIANVGDSRCYRLDGAGIRRITTDHSLVERLVVTGQITAAEAENHPQRNVIYRAIGDKPTVEVDLYTQQLSAGEALLLCSDGLSGMMSDERLLQIWRTSVSPQEACDRMVDAANRAGGEDNITAVIVQAAP